MCLIFFAYNAHPHYKLVVAANRDEFYSRPSKFAEYWSDSPNILAGRDLVYGGTWLGMTTTGRFTAVTNYREPNSVTGTKSRGDLTKDFLAANMPPEKYLSEIQTSQNDYSGFNLLAGDFAEDKNELFYLSNRADAGIKKLLPGIYGLSNHLLDTNWFKVERGKVKFAQIMAKKEEISSETLFEILGNRLMASNSKLPNTGIGIERERVLSSAFIETEVYGTRSSTVLLIEKSGQTTFIEKTFAIEPGERNYEFLIGN